MPKIQIQVQWQLQIEKEVHEILVTIAGKQKNVDAFRDENAQSAIFYPWLTTMVWNNWYELPKYKRLVKWKYKSYQKYGHKQYTESNTINFNA